MAAIANKNFVSSTAAAHANFQFIIGDNLPIENWDQEDAAATARYTVNCPDNDLIIDMRRLTHGPNMTRLTSFGPKWPSYWRGGWMIAVMEARCLCL
jgi:hypothetical protein